MGRNTDNTSNVADNEKRTKILYANFHSLIDEPKLAECFLALPDKECYLNIHNTSAIDSSLVVQSIHENQNEDTELLIRKDKYSDYYFEK